MRRLFEEGDGGCGGGIRRRIPSLVGDEATRGGSTGSEGAAAGAECGEAYIGRVRRYVAFHGMRRPLELSEEEVVQLLRGFVVRG